MSVVGCLVFVVCCLLSVVGCLVFGVCCLLSVVCCFLSVVCCQLFVVWCLVSIVCCLLSVVCCLLSVVCCLLSFVCCLVSIVWCLKIYLITEDILTLLCFFNKDKWNQAIFIFSSFIYRVTHKGCNFKDDCIESISVYLYLKPLKYFI